jgi:hypothetical protein
MGQADIPEIYDTVKVTFNGGGGAACASDAPKATRPTHAIPARLFILFMTLLLEMTLDITSFVDRRPCKASWCQSSFFLGGGVVTTQMYTKH